MRRASMTIAVALVTLSLSAAFAAPQEKEKEKQATGKVTAVSADSVTVDVNGTPMMFMVDTTTEVIARGAGTKTRETEATTGRKPAIADLVKVGDNVQVRYTESGGTMTAKVIRGGVNLPKAGTGTAASDATKRLQGVVSEVTGTSLTIKPASGEAMNFMVDQKARVTGRGVGTMAKEKQAEGTKLTLTDAIAVGDTVDVTYKSMGDMHHVTAVRLIKKGSEGKF